MILPRSSFKCIYKAIFYYFLKQEGGKLPNCKLLIRTVENGNHILKKKKKKDKQTMCYY